MAKKPLMPLDRIGEVLHAALQEIDDRDGSAPANEVLKAVESRVHLTDTELGLNKSGFPRWETNLRYWSTSCVKAGYLQKGNGYWKITGQGRQALKLTPAQLIRDVGEKYKAWDAQRGITQSAESETDVELEERSTSTARAEIYEKAEEQAQSIIEEFIHALGPTIFRSLWATCFEVWVTSLRMTHPPVPMAALI